MQDPKHDEPGHIQHYEGGAAIEKLKELAENARMCMFTTFAKSLPMPSRPMALQTVEDDGTLQFFSAKSSNKNMEIAQDSHVQLFFGNSGDNEDLSLYGTAKVSTDRAKIKELWNPIAKVWFQDGADDPDLTLISVTPIETKYWDTKHNKLVAILKMGAAIITGKTLDDGVEGVLKVK
jgi:general stress protein 26